MVPIVNLMLAIKNSKMFINNDDYEYLNFSYCKTQIMWFVM